MKRKILFLISALISTSIYAENLLEGYLANDLELQRLALEVQKYRLSNKETEISNGIDLQLSSGTASFQFSDTGTVISLNPSAKISIPQASNLAVSASSDMSFSTESQDFKNTSIKLSADIISGNSITRKINLMQAERSLLTAKRNLQNRALEAEKEYYTELKSLYNSAINLIKKQKDLYDDTIDFQQIQAKGYSKTSSKYRQAEMKVLSDNHEIETSKRTLEHDCVVFASKCDKEFPEGTSAIDVLKEEVPHVHPVNILDFPQTTYTKIEEATWSQTIAELKRQADKNFTLSANGGYTFNNSVSKSYSDTIDAGLSAGWEGLSVNTGVSIPVVSENRSPIFTIGASVNPNKFRTAGIKNQTNDINRQEEYISIASAVDKYNTSVVDKQSEFNDLRWSKKTDSETYEMYVSLADDLEKYLEAGVITESEYLNAFANKESYRIKMLLDDINLIIYNNETKLLFTRDDEIKD